MKKRNNNKNRSNNKKVAAIASTNNIKVVSRILLGLAVLALIITSVVLIATRTPYAKEAKKWDSLYKTNHTSYVCYLNTNTGNYECDSNPYITPIILASSPLPTGDPAWVTEGIRQLESGNESEQALYAAKYLSIQHDFSQSNYKNICIALGFAKFQYPENYSDEEMEKITLSLRDYLSGIYF